VLIIPSRSKRAMNPDTGRGSRFLPIQPASRRNIAVTFGMEKLKWCGYLIVKNCQDMLIRFDRTYERDRPTDRQTPHDGIDRAYA